MQPTVDFTKQRERLFPKLTPDQIKRICPFRSPPPVKARAGGYEEGEGAGSFMVILEGQLEVTARGGRTPQLITIHERGDFTGETNLLSGRPSLVHGEMRTDGEVLEVPVENLRRIVQIDSELSE